MSTLSLPTEPQNAFFTGDIDVFNGLTASAGDGSVYVRNGGLYVEGLTDLDQTTIQTNDGNFTVSGPNKAVINISGGATSSVEITAEDPSFFTTTAGLLTLSSTDTGANGKISILAAGTGPDSILINATDAVSGQISVVSAGASTTSEAIKLLASDTVDGNITITGAGNFASNNPAVSILASNAVSGQVLLTSAGDSATVDAVVISATGATNGRVLIQGNGAGDSVEIVANNVGGRIDLNTISTLTDSITATTAGGVLVDAVGRVVIDSDDVTNGIKIATGTSGVPVTIGTSTSLTTIAGNLDITGTFTTINTETLEVEDNFIIINSGGGEAGLDTGILMKRFQAPNGAGTGDVTNNPSPVQESGSFTATGTATTLSLDEHSSNTVDFYKGWWIKVTSGPEINSVRRIKSYNQTTKVATIYATADNVVGPPAFTDGLDLAGTVVANNTYRLYSRPFTTLFYGETDDEIKFASIANAPDAIGTAGVSTAAIQQYQAFSSGAHKIQNQVYRNARAIGDGTTAIVTVNLIGHGEVIGNKVRITDSFNLTPAITPGIYLVNTVPTVDSFTIIAPAITTSDDTASSVTVTALHTSVLYANIIQPFDPDFGPTVIPGLAEFVDILIPRGSVAYFSVSIADTVGTYNIFVTNITPGYTAGAYSLFAATGNGVNNSISRLVASKGTGNERIDATWVAGEKPKIRHSPAAGAGSPAIFTYRVKLFSGE